MCSWVLLPPLQNCGCPLYCNIVVVGAAPGAVGMVVVVPLGYLWILGYRVGTRLWGVMVSCEVWLQGPEPRRI